MPLHAVQGMLAASVVLSVFSAVSWATLPQQALNSVMILSWGAVVIGPLHSSLVNVIE